MHETQVLAPVADTLGVRDVARVMGYHPQWIYRLNRAGQLPFKPLPLRGRKLRFSRREVEQWAAGQSRPAVA